MIEVGSLDSNADSNARRYTVVHQGPPKFARAPRPAAMDDNGPRQTPSGTPAGYWFESSRGSITAGVSARSTQVHCSRPIALRPPQPFDGSGRNDGRVVVELTVVALQPRSESRSEPSQALRGVLAIAPVLLQREAHLAGHASTNSWSVIGEACSSAQSSARVRCRSYVRRQRCSHGGALWDTAGLESERPYRSGCSAAASQYWCPLDAAGPRAR